jgi:membrane fusion protein (multidrug efflux system)
MRVRKKTVARYFVVIVGLLVLVGALVVVKFLQISSLMAMGKEAEQAGPPPETVSATVARVESWEATLLAVGSVQGVKSVTVANDSPGRVKRIRFESGQLVKQGQVLVELDTSVERAELASARARHDLALVSANRSRALVSAQVTPQAQLDIDEARLQTSKSEVSSLHALIDKKIVRAPIRGRLGIRAVDVGEYLNPGTTVTTLEQVGAVFVDFTLPQQSYQSVKEGMPVRVALDDPHKTVFEGTISAVDPRLDDTTRSIRLRASIPNEQDRLRPGMFVNVTVETPKRSNLVIVPQTAIVHAPYGDSVFVIEDKPPGSPGWSHTPDGKPVKIVRQQFVRLGEARGDFVAILQGIKAGQAVVSAGAFKLRNGAPVVIDDRVQMQPKLNPRPENR